MKNPYLIFIAVVVVLSAFFYFYQVDLFQAEITRNGESFISEVSFNSFFTIKKESAEASIRPTLQGWLLLAAIFLGLPTMIAYRVTLKRYPRRAAKEE